MKKSLIITVIIIVIILGFMMFNKNEEETAPASIAPLVEPRGPAVRVIGAEELQSNNQGQ
ncbi:hypothetical protein A2331_00505 [Candidatus Falkowbacteria bacterium RIFOXYB2_FULL_34_18]|uniref:Uncharacterized protein n=1 Tax=Candidatus Falkowbacteria bacterium RIFOXYD2_FULL_34_120 TaxID=1798007 RepID=A0A1F5TPH0_9BACT|nr:MAG: hypothetical protein A2331_00505 [Candidatus Falkowbacteria bacterium RIFOXYB2_FULL_34_18]OGF29035.1 MAG: hypothetical protein A2500_01905 [Candidatus Falkowbacteria bacterium RIFOXYC12_FULL_34_55]OGF36068.1 MAG: hypothetical protein A2466_00205 [Candidatus Falkowbacteria bacterium RIFOXYC2_FULL_34_220]OGF38546.1 MAG: hypothetical protein A2515_05165 [Candidatus Falkowbacteria bacterium RIFOXYD12_FULL_34_57]OGF40709.1 MAG: hypothetical protein A2531_05705 [Candidatus Falkowbacteria bact